MPGDFGFVDYPHLVGSCWSRKGVPGFDPSPEGGLILGDQVTGLGTDLSDPVTGL